MNTPFGMVGAALLFWGWQTGWLWLAVPLAVAIEARVLWRPAWTLDAKEINRFADLSSLALVAVGAWFLVTLEPPRTARTVMGMAQWLPMTLAPLAIAQAYLVRTPLDLSVLLVTLRARPETGVRVDFGFVYVIACVLAAATANVRNEMFYGGAAVFAAWSLWNLRSRRYPRIVPFAMLMVASVMGYAGHVGLNQLQGAVTEWVGEIIGRSIRTNPFRTHTEIGTIGELKQSDRILLRVRLPEGQRAPLLLHRASYNIFSSPSWIARPVNFETLRGEPEVGWALREPVSTQMGDAGSAPSWHPGTAVEVLEYARNGKTILSLPLGTAHLDGLPPAEIRRSRLGSTSIETAPGFMRYRAHRGEGALVESPPEEVDLRIPPREAGVIRAVAAELGLVSAAANATARSSAGGSVDAAEVRRRIEAFFVERFRYTTWLEASPPNAPTPLASFLTRTRAGHCEYFASATTLLFREAGIPARYATGFSVQEKSRGEDYLVRERHAHAWVRVWINNAWVDVDTTPPQWFAIESGAGDAWETLGDAWSWLRFAWGRYQTADDEVVPRPVLIGLLFILFGWLAWRIFRQPAKREEHKAGREAAAPVSGMDSDFYRIVELLAARDLGRLPAEPVSAWLTRLAQSGIGVDRIDELAAIARLHYRLRFDPQPMEQAMRDELRQRVTDWLLGFEVSRRSVRPGVTD